MAKEAESIPEEKPKLAVSLGAPSISSAIEQMYHNNNYAEMSDKQIQYELHKGVADQVDIADNFAVLNKDKEFFSSDNVG